ncbi:CRTAC1 family protein [Hydrogenophaga luteola]|uniref:CRTAC1 family protein n=1 Tax=Hydrogenophaga luteola TaxID=1591122 RepID=A0ABV7W846_9BURK
MKMSVRLRLPQIVALALVLGLGMATTESKVSNDQMSRIADSFSLATPVELDSTPGISLSNVRKVHPSLERISGWISSVGASVALGDIDGDGLPNDLCDVDPRTDKVTLRPVPGTTDRYKPFTMDLERAKFDATMAPMGCMFGDLNEDGYLDVIVYYWGRTPVAFLQREAYSGLLRQAFEEIELVPNKERWFTNSATLADFDGDGHIDILFANYFPDGSDTLNTNGTGLEEMHDTKSKSFNGGRKHFLLFKSAAGGSNPMVTFQSVQPFADPKIDRSWTLAVAASDIDGDGLSDLYLSNDFGPDRLLHNRSTPGHLDFRILEGTRDFLTPKSAVLGQDSFKGMGAEVGDINGDGLPDILVSNIAAPFSLQESHMVWVNSGDKEAIARGEAPYTQQSERLGLSRSGWGWDIKLADLNNDGTPEVLQATGFLKGDIDRWPELQALATSNDRIMSNPRFWPRFRPGDDLSGHQTNPVFARDVSGRFVDIGPQLGIAEQWVTRGIALADVDGDGLLDIVYANQWEPSAYVQNECRGCGGFLGLRLLLQKDSSTTQVVAGRPRIHLPAAIGARVTLLTGDDKPMRTGQIDGGNGHSGRRSPELHFGLGASPKPQQVKFEWRSFDGKLQTKTLTVGPGWQTVLLGA